MFTAFDLTILNISFPVLIPAQVFYPHRDKIRGQQRLQWQCKYDLLPPPDPPKIDVHFDPDICWLPPHTHNIHPTEHFRVFGRQVWSQKVSLSHRWPPQCCCCFNAEEYVHFFVRERWESPCGFLPLQCSMSRSWFMMMSIVLKLSPLSKRGAEPPRTPQFCSLIHRSHNKSAVLKAEVLPCCLCATY